MIDILNEGSEDAQTINTSNYVFIRRFDGLGISTPFVKKVVNLLLK